MKKIIKWFKDNNYDIYLTLKDEMYIKKDFPEHGLVHIYIRRNNFINYILEFYADDGENYTLLIKMEKIKYQKTIINYLEMFKAKELIKEQ